MKYWQRRDRRTWCVVNASRAVLASAVVTAGLSACGSSNAAPDLITLAQAKQVALTWLHADNKAAVAQEGGSVQRIDEADAAMNPPASSSAPDGQTHNATIWMAHQSRYPLTFLCVDTPAMERGQAPAQQLFRFSKASPTTPWTVTHQDLLFSPASRPSLALDAAGYAQMVPAHDAGKLLASPAQLAADWVAYLSAGNLSDAHEFAPGPLTTGQIENNQKQVDAAAGQHDRLTTSYTVSDDPVDAYLERDGSALVLVGITVTAHTVAQSGSIKVTQDGKGVAGPVPGSYRDITDVVLVLAAFTDPAKDGGSKAAAIGTYYGPVTATGTRA